MLLMIEINGCISSQPDQCGKPATTAQIPRILGGSGVVGHSQPWLARLGPCCQCTGTLISDRHILTAAHCDLFVNPRVATLGDYDSQKVETIASITMMKFYKKKSPGKGTISSKNPKRLIIWMKIV